MKQPVPPRFWCDLLLTIPRHDLSRDYHRWLNLQTWPELGGACPEKCTLGEQAPARTMSMSHLGKVEGEVQPDGSLKPVAVIWAGQRYTLVLEPEQPAEPVPPLIGPAPWSGD